MTFHRNTRVQKVCERILRTDRVGVYFHEGTRHWFVGVLSTRGGERGIATVFPLNQDPTGNDGPKLTFEEGEDLAWNFFQAGGRDRQRAIVENARMEHNARVENTKGRKQEIADRRQCLGEKLRSNHPYWGRSKRQRYRKVY